MTVFVKNITINSGEDFVEEFNLLSADGSGAVDLTGFSAQSQIRKNASSYQFADLTIGFPNATQGLIQVSIASTISEKWRPGRYVYDIILTRPSGFKLVGVEGSALVRAGISTHTHLYGSP
tara:strand:+ start:55 stop:417 length:363 start_codon:yes stop_codon:yes gene_type:complete